MKEPKLNVKVIDILSPNPHRFTRKLWLGNYYQEMTEEDFNDLHKAVVAAKKRGTP